MKYRVLIILTLTTFVIPAWALAQPDVTVELRAEKTVQTEENGQSKSSTVPADRIVPGEVLTYTLAYRNKGDEPATGVKLQSLIPEGTTYLENSASNEGPAPLFSADGGETFEQSERLQKTETGPDGQSLTESATPHDYDAIRWIIDRLPAGASGELSFKVKVNEQ